MIQKKQVQKKYLTHAISISNKTPSKLGIKENFLNVIKRIYKKFTDNMLKGYRLNIFPLNQEQDAADHSHHLCASL